jgi:hypothetical protein
MGEIIELGNGAYTGGKGRMRRYIGYALTA